MIEPQETIDDRDWRAAMLASVSAQLAGVKPGAAKIARFLPNRKKSKTVLSRSQQAMILDGMTGGKMPPHILKRFGAR
jgi:hypothetical protein